MEITISSAKAKKEIMQARDFQTLDDYRAANPGLRYGEAFCLFYDVPDDQLYKEEDEGAAKERAALHMANWELCG